MRDDPTDGFARVRLVKDGFPLAGLLRAGDRVVRVDATDTSRMSKAQLIAADGPVASRADRGAVRRAWPPRRAATCGRRRLLSSVLKTQAALY